MSDLILPESIRRASRVYGVVKDGPMKGFDNLYFEYDDKYDDGEFPELVVLADNSPNREAQRRRELRLRELQTLHRHVDPAKRDMVEDLEKQKPRKQYVYGLEKVFRPPEPDPPVPVYSYRGEYRRAPRVEKKAAKAKPILLP